MFRDIFIVLTGRGGAAGIQWVESRMRPQMSIVPRLREPALARAGRTVSLHLAPGPKTQRSIFTSLALFVFIFSGIP